MLRLFQLRDCAGGELLQALLDEVESVFPLASAVIERGESAELEGTL